MRKMGGIAICLLAALVLASIAGAQAQGDGLVAEWHFDGDGKDSSGNGNDGTIHGATWVDGKFGKALSFDGVDDYVDIGNSINPTHITVSAWWYGVSFRGTGNNPIVGKGYTSHEPPYYQYHLGVTGDKYPNTPGTYGFGISVGGISYGVSSSDTYTAGAWNFLVGTYDGETVKIYRNGELKCSDTKPSGNIDIFPTTAYLAKFTDLNYYLPGIIDEVRIYNRALSAEEIKEQYEGKQTASTVLTLTKTASPYSIKQGQTTTITLTIKNTGTTDITNIEVMDSIHRNFDLIAGDFPNPKKYDIIRQGESREIQYSIKAKESGTFNLDPVIGIYADNKGNIQEVKSVPFSIKVIPSFESTPLITSPSPSTNSLKSASVSLTGEKTDVVLGEDILLKLSAVNLITKPKMRVQVIIIPPSGMSVTSSEFSKSGTNQFTANYELEPGDGKDIGVSIKPNQIGDFNVNGRIIYYFGDEKDKAEDHTLNLPIKVRKEIASTPAQNPIENPAQKSTPGFGVIIGISGLLLVMLLKRKQ